MKFSAPFYLAPYFMINNPVILSKAQPLFEAIPALLALAIACGAMLVFCQNFCYTKTSLPERILFLLTALLATCYGQYGHAGVLVAVMILFTVLMIFQRKKRRQRGD